MFQIKSEAHFEQWHLSNC